MYKDTTYKEKFAILKEWTPHLIDKVKKDLKNEHLKQDYAFSRKYLPGKNLSKVTLEDLVEGYTQAIAQEETGEKIAEYIATRWMLQSSELYSFFEQELSRINPNFDAIQEIEEPVGERLIAEGVSRFGAVNTYLFAVINSVAFRKNHFDALQKQAQDEQQEKRVAAEQAKELTSFEELKGDFERRLARLEDKYEKKIDGLQRKYIKDTEALKKQLAALQRKLNVCT